MELPTAQKELYEYLLSLPPEDPPTLRELAEVLSVSFSAIQSRLDGLKAKGLVQSTPGAARSLRVIRPGQVWVAVPESRLPLVDAVIRQGDSIPMLVRALEAIAKEQRLKDYNPEKVPL